jgi:hypothetical protein
MGEAQQQQQLLAGSVPGSTVAAASNHISSTKTFN